MGGVKTEAMLESAKPVTADALVLIVGTNDYSGGVPFEATAANISGFVDKSEDGRVIISAVPPRDASPATATDSNANLQALAAAQGWEFIDAVASSPNLAVLPTEVGYAVCWCEAFE